MALDAIKAPATKDLCATLGASFTKTFTLTQGGSPLDLTGYTAEALIFDGQKQQVGTFTAAVDVPETDGQVTISLTVAEVEALPKVKMRWWLKLVLTADPPNNTHFILVGAFAVNDPADEDDCC